MDLENQENQEKEHLKFVIVGHVDHGKSTLIGRLFYDTGSLPEDKIDEIKTTCEALGRDIEFGFIMDHLEEEREQGITIDTAQTFFKTKKREYVIIDAPGHVEFIKNMITGASQAEAAILIVDADEGVKEQTKRHSYLLNLLGLKQITVVINKMDLINHDQEKFNRVKKELITFLSQLNIKPTHIIPISAKNGDNIAKRSENMSWYAGATVLESLDSFQPKKSLAKQPLRFPIQDVYKIEEKRINVGRIESGTLRIGENVVILPENKKTKIRSIEKYLEPVSQAEAGYSTGFTTEDALFLERGMVICHEENRPQITNALSANVFWMAKQPFDLSQPITLKIATQETICRVEKITNKINSSTLEKIEDNSLILKELEVGTLHLKTEKPIVIDTFNVAPALGRFVLEQDQNTCAGGIIINSKTNTTSTAHHNTTPNQTNSNLTNPQQSSHPQNETPLINDQPPKKQTIVLAIDGLEYKKVEEFNCQNLKQKHYGKTNITEFSQPRTMVLWSSFMTGQNKEREVLDQGNQEMWNTSWPLEQTFFSNFQNPFIVDLPGFNYNLIPHEKSRKDLKRFFEATNPEEKEAIRKEYNQDAFTHHRQVKEEFLNALKQNHDFVLGYFSLADVIGHLNFGNNILMKMIYQEFDGLANIIKKNNPDANLLILSDHGMEAIGMFGDHSNYGFWSNNLQDLKEPKITEVKDSLLKTL